MHHDRSYWAGFFDGEGCIMIKLSQKPRVAKPQLSLCVSVSNTHLGVMQQLIEDWPPPCGRVLSSYLGGPRDQLKRRQQYKWSLSGRSAYEFLIALLPSLTVKKEQAELAVEFFNLPWRSRRKDRGGTWKIRTTDNVKTDLGYYERMKGMKYAIDN